jgi:hypothetical protein
VSLKAWQPFSGTRCRRPSRPKQDAGLCGMRFVPVFFGTPLYVKPCKQITNMRTDARSKTASIRDTIPDLGTPVKRIALFVVVLPILSFQQRVLENGLYKGSRHR